MVKHTKVAIVTDMDFGLLIFISSHIISAKEDIKFVSGEISLIITEQVIDNGDILETEYIKINYLSDLKNEVYSKIYIDIDSKILRDVFSIPSLDVTKIEVFNTTKGILSKKEIDNLIYSFIQKQNQDIVKYKDSTIKVDFK